MRCRIRDGPRGSHQLLARDAKCRSSSEDTDEDEDNGDEAGEEEDEEEDDVL